MNHDAILPLSILAIVIVGFYFFVYRKNSTQKVLDFNGYVADQALDFFLDATQMKLEDVEKDEDGQFHIYSSIVQENAEGKAIKVNLDIFLKGHEDEEGPDAQVISELQDGVWVHKVKIG